MTLAHNSTPPVFFEEKWGSGGICLDDGEIIARTGVPYEGLLERYQDMAFVDAYKNKTEFLMGIVKKVTGYDALRGR